MPQTLVPLLGFSTGPRPYSLIQPRSVRKDVLQLAESLEACASWGCGRVLMRWADKQPWSALAAEHTAQGEAEVVVVFRAFDLRTLPTRCLHLQDSCRCLAYPVALGPELESFFPGSRRQQRGPANRIGSQHAPTSRNPRGLLQRASTFLFAGGTRSRGTSCILKVCF